MSSTEEERPASTPSPSTVPRLKYDTLANYIACKRCGYKGHGGESGRTLHTKLCEEPYIEPPPPPTTEQKQTQATKRRQRTARAEFKKLRTTPTEPVSCERKTYPWKCDRCGHLGVGGKSLAIQHAKRCYHFQVVLSPPTDPPEPLIRISFQTKILKCVVCSLGFTKYEDVAAHEETCYQKKKRSPPPIKQFLTLKGLQKHIDKLTQYNKLLVNNIELCQVSVAEVVQNNKRNNPIFPKQVGLRCIHCNLRNQYSSGSTAYPGNITGLTTHVSIMGRHLLEKCPSIPSGLKSKLAEEKECWNNADKIPKRGEGLGLYLDKVIDAVGLGDGDGEERGIWFMDGEKWKDFL